MIFYRNRRCSCGHSPFESDHANKRQRNRERRNECRTGVSTAISYTDFAGHSSAAVLVASFGNDRYDTRPGTRVRPRRASRGRPEAPSPVFRPISARTRRNSRSKRDRPNTDDARNGKSEIYSVNVCFARRAFPVDRKRTRGTPEDRRLAKSASRVDSKPAS